MDSALSCCLGSVAPFAQTLLRNSVSVWFKQAFLEAVFPPAGQSERGRRKAGVSQLLPSQTPPSFHVAVGCVILDASHACQTPRVEPFPEPRTGALWADAFPAALSELGSDSFKGLMSRAGLEVGLTRGPPQLTDPRVVLSLVSRASSPDPLEAGLALRRPSLLMSRQPVPNLGPRPSNGVALLQSRWL